jgi:nucleoside-diphosphate-sugar epimerase
MNTILVTGSRGQIGSDLVVELRRLYGNTQVIESGRSAAPILASSSRRGAGGEVGSMNYEVLDVNDKQRIEAIVKQYRIDTIYHLASLLSAKGEQNPHLCWDVNVNGLKNVLEVAKSHHLKVFWPSSIAVFGPHTPKLDTPQIAVEDPSTMYGITKVTGELLCNYYAQRFGVDVRSLRLPGIISYNTLPGGGTTDFAVEIFYEAIKHGSYTCFVRPDTRLPMMYMPDAIAAILQLMAADEAAIKIRTSYNLTAVSFSAAELVAEIQQHLPDFTCEYAPDFRQAIADSWPSSIDDSPARNDWGWQHTYNLQAIVKDMLLQLGKREEGVSEGGGEFLTQHSTLNT